MTTGTYYDRLGLAPFANGAMVDQAYWHLAKTYQALVDADPRAREALDELNAAYSVLGTPRLRDEYDATIRGVVPPRRHGKQAADQGSSANDGGSRFSLKWPFGRTKSDAGPESIRWEDRKAAVHETYAASHDRVASPRQARTGDVQDLHTSTARMLERWRATAATATESEADKTAPDMTLVDIFKSEQELETREDPLAAVMDILKAPKGAVPTAPER